MSPISGIATSGLIALSLVLTPYQTAGIRSGKIGHRIGDREFRLIVWEGVEIGLIGILLGLISVIALQLRQGYVVSSQEIR